MKAITYLHYGGPEVLRPKMITKPQPNPNELLIRVYATTVNRIDINRRRGLSHTKNASKVLGVEIAGEVESKRKKYRNDSKKAIVFLDLSMRVVMQNFVRLMKRWRYLFLSIGVMNMPPLFQKALSRHQNLFFPLAT